MDYGAVRAVAAVAQTGSFDRAAQLLNVTPSAVSQRVKQLEERLGAALIARGAPCIATEQGDRLCRHLERVGLLERELFADLPQAGTDVQPVTLHIAVNADSLGTWFIDAVADYTHNSGNLVSLAVDDEGHTDEWLAKGRVLAAVSANAKPVVGCRSVSLGALRYRATAAPDFVARYFPGGVSLAALRVAPALMFNGKDRLQAEWMAKAFGQSVAHSAHWLPSTHAFVEAAVAGMGWGMNPEMLVAEHLKSGRLVELIPDFPLNISLYWQVNRFSADGLAELTRAVRSAGTRHLLPPQPAGKLSP